MKCNIYQSASIAKTKEHKKGNDNIIDDMNVGTKDKDKDNGKE